MPDPSLADVAVVRVVAGVVAAILAALGIWGRFFKTRRTVAGDEGERIRFEDSINDARLARKEAHDAINIAMGMQRQMGRLEAENKACVRRSRQQAVRIGRLERENTEQARQIDSLIKKKTFNPTDSDFA